MEAQAQASNHFSKISFQTTPTSEATTNKCYRHNFSKAQAST